VSRTPVINTYSNRWALLQREPPRGVDLPAPPSVRSLALQVFEVLVEIPRLLQGFEHLQQVTAWTCVRMRYTRACPRLARVLDHAHNHAESGE